MKSNQGIKLTPRQEDTLHFIRAFQALNGYSPSLEEIAEGIGIVSKTTVHGYIDKLVKAGKIERKGKRAIKII